MPVGRELGLCWNSHYNLAVGVKSQVGEKKVKTMRHAKNMGQKSTLFQILKQLSVNSNYNTKQYASFNYQLCWNTLFICSLICGRGRVHPETRWRRDNPTSRMRFVFMGIHIKWVKQTLCPLWINVMVNEHSWNINIALSHIESSK